MATDDDAVRRALADDAGVRKTPDELASGDWVLVNIPCKVRITKVTPCEGNEHQGNRALTYVAARPVSYAGMLHVGEKVSVTVVP